MSGIYPQSNIPSWQQAEWKGSSDVQCVGHDFAKRVGWNISSLCMLPPTCSDETGHWHATQCAHLAAASSGRRLCLTSAPTHLLQPPLPLPSLPPAAPPTLPPSVSPWLPWVEPSLTALASSGDGTACMVAGAVPAGDWMAGGKDAVRACIAFDDTAQELRT